MAEAWPKFPTILFEFVNATYGGLFNNFGIITTGLSGIDSGIF